VLGALAAAFAVFIQHNFFHGVDFVSLGDVVLAFAFSTYQSKNDALIFFGHIF